jgi:hypothetical protein
MEFSVGRPDMVRAINQRWLLKFWKRSLAGNALPHWQSVENENLTRIAASLSFLDVTDADGSARFMIRSSGATIAQVYGRTDCSGRFLGEIIPPNRHDQALAPYRHAVRMACPVYTIGEVTDRNGRLVSCERLLLPFASHGETVDRILASFEFICIDGAFESHELMKDQSGPPLMRLSAAIGREAMA